MKRLLAALALVAGTALGQADNGWVEVANGWGEIQNGTVPYTSPSTGTLDIRPGSLIANNITATALATPTVTSVTPTLTKIGSITTVAGASLVDGDYFTIKYAPGLTVPIEFDAAPGNGTTGGRVPYVFAPGDTADQIRDGLIVLLNAAAPTQLTASSGGAATVSISLNTPGAAGDTNTENVANAGFAVTGFSNPTAATTYGYKAVSYLADGTSTAASTEVTTAAGHATLSASNYNTVVFAPSAGSVSTRLYRTTGGAAPPKLLYTGTALSYVDTGAAGTAQTPATANTTGRVLVGDGSAAAPSVAFADGSGLHSVSSGIGFAASNGTRAWLDGSAFQLFAAGYIGWSSTSTAQGTRDLILSRAAAATLQLGAASAAVPVAQTLQAQGALAAPAPGAVTDVAGANLTIRPGAGTGNATPPSLLFQIPAAVGSGTTAQTQYTRLTISPTSIQAALPVTPDTTDTRSLGTSTARWSNVYAREVTLYPGTGTASARASGVLHVSTTAQATTGTSEEILATYTMPANTLARDGQAVRITAWFTHAANTNAATVRIRVGGIGGDIIVSQASSVSADVLRCTAEVVRTGATAMTVSGVGMRSGAFALVASTPAQTLSNALDIVVTGATATAAGDVTFKGLIVEALN